MTFGQKLRKIRDEKGMSQQELAKRLGYKTNSYVSDMEKGKFVPSLGKMKKIAKALGISFSKLKGFLVESRLKEIGVKDPFLISIVTDYPSLTGRNKKAIIKAYLKTQAQK